MEKIALIAGGGRLPIIFAEKARTQGAKIIGIGIKGMASSDLGNFCNRTHWLDPREIKKLFLLFIIERIKKVVMLGKVDKSIIYAKINKNDKTLNILKNSENKSDYAILEKVTSEFEKRGIKVINGIEYLSDLLPSKGVLTKRVPTQKEYDDISFGFKTAKEIARTDIGQTIVIKDKSVVSIEAMEGTDRTIERAAKLCTGFVVVKVSRPQQDMRWDVPVVGPETIKLIVENKGKVLAMEEKRMFLVEKEASIELADKNDISIVVM
ncbi:MAG: UDP-2,3-diacylglucosamine diphosphatase LpxI [Candidatus Omnitrophota bacterium]|nr:MAG: UDP-2,3-diacylglucosamine diphosphatase LpxI [Candidatus Omnitrophota bacterium]